MKHLANPLVLTGAWEAQVMTEEQMKQLHVDVPRMRKQFILDTIVAVFSSATMALISVFLFGMRGSASRR